MSVHVMSKCDFIAKLEKAPPTPQLVFFNREYSARLIVEFDLTNETVGWVDDVKSNDIHTIKIDSFLTWMRGPYRRSDLVYYIYGGPAYRQM